jgi:hypothetical protein
LDEREKKESELVEIGTFWPHPVECSPETIEDRGNPSSESLNTTRKEDQNCMKNTNYLYIPFKYVEFRKFWSL